MYDFQAICTVVKCMLFRQSIDMHKIQALPILATHARLAEGVTCEVNQPRRMARVNS